MACNGLEIASRRTQNAKFRPQGGRVRGKAANRRGREGSGVIIFVLQISHIGPGVIVDIGFYFCPLLLVL